MRSQSKKAVDLRENGVCADVLYVRALENEVMIVCANVEETSDS